MHCPEMAVGVHPGVLICAFLRENKEKSVVQYTIRKNQIQQRNSCLFAAGNPSPAVPVPILIKVRAARRSIQELYYPFRPELAPLQQVLIDFIMIFGYYSSAFIYLNRFSGGFPWAK